jgi:hypothetical protein
VLGLSDSPSILRVQKHTGTFSRAAREESLRDRSAQLSKRLQELRGNLAAAEARRACVAEEMKMHAEHGCAMAVDGKAKAAGKVHPLVDTSQDRLVVQHHITTTCPASTRTFLGMRSPPRPSRFGMSVSLPSSPSARPRHASIVDPRTAPRVQHTSAHALTLAHTPSSSSSIPTLGHGFSQAILFSPEPLLSPTRRSHAASRDLHEYFSPLLAMASGLQNPPHDALTHDGGRHGDSSSHTEAESSLRPSHAPGEPMPLAEQPASTQRHPEREQHAEEPGPHAPPFTAVTLSSLLTQQLVDPHQVLEPGHKEEGMTLSLDAFGHGDVPFSPLLHSHDPATWLAHSAPDLIRQQDHVLVTELSLNRHQNDHSPGSSHGARPYPRRSTDHALAHAGTECGIESKPTAFISLPNLFGLPESAARVDAPTLVSPPAVAPRSSQSLYPAHEHLK